MQENLVCTGRLNPSDDTDGLVLVCQNAPHAIGTGTGTDAEGWLEEAAAFWDSQVKEMTR